MAVKVPAKIEARGGVVLCVCVCMWVHFITSTRLCVAGWSVEPFIVNEDEERYKRMMGGKQMERGDE